MSARADYLEWRRKAAIGCLFARWFSSHPNEHGQVIEEVSQSDNPQRAASAIAKRIDTLLAEPSVSDAGLILPGIKTIEGLTRTALALADFPKWEVTIDKVLPPPTLDLRAVHIVRKIPLGARWFSSEVLAFGPFRVLPATRRAPVTVLEVFVGKPMPRDPKTHKPKTNAHLAEMDLSDTELTPQQIDRFWDKSHTGRLTSLSGVEDNRAKAKVSFVITPALAQKLGCEP
jgi:hypothetical protein